jgi:hypothetical protein
MYSFLTQYVGALFDLLADLWLYMIIGFVVAGVVDEFVSRERLLRYFGANDLLSLVRAVASGFLVSACSCGAIPLAAMLRSRGASTATTLAFLFAAPWLGVPMLLVYISFIGWYLTAFLVVLSLSIALVAGLAMGVLERRGAIAQGARYRDESAEPEPEQGDTCVNGCEDDGCDDECEVEERSDLRGRLLVNVPKRAWFFGKDIGFYLLIGMCVAAIGKAFVPAEWVAAHMGSGSGPAALLIAFPVSVVIEVCSEGFAVVSGQLYEMGASLAVVFMMTLVGTATDFTELSVVWGKFGRRTTLAYTAICTSLTLATALALQMLL